MELVEGNERNYVWNLRARLVVYFKQLFEHFKYIYTHFHIFFTHTYIKNIQTTLLKLFYWTLPKSLELDFNVARSRNLSLLYSSYYSNIESNNLEMLIS